MFRLQLMAAAALLAGAAQADEPAAPAKLSSHSYAQHLVDQALAAHKDVVVMAMHVTPPKAKQNVIIASNIGRLGKAADADDLRVVTTGQAGVAVNAAGDRLEVEEPLEDVEGNVIGALGIVFPYKAGDDKQARRAEADAIRDQMAKRTLHVRNLLDPWPYDPRFSANMRAQALVDAMVAAHPELLVFAIHATPPGSKTNVILGSTIGRIGKKADEDDLRVIDKGVTNREISDTGKRFEAELPLNDARGRRIGALGVVLPYKPGDDKDALVAHAEQIRDELARQIASPADLVRLSPGR